MTRGVCGCISSRLLHRPPLFGMPSASGSAPNLALRSGASSSPDETASSGRRTRKRDLPGTSLASEQAPKILA